MQYNIHTEQHKPINIGPFRSSEREIIDLLKSWVAISIAFTILRAGLNLSVDFLETLLISAITVGLGFLLHEMGHKIMAQKYGCFAEFRSDDKMLILAIVLSFTGFLFAAPGAVVIAGPIGLRRNGMISIAGPAVNYILAICFLLLTIFFYPIDILLKIGAFGFMINSWLGLFNMIPFGMFDGAKILRWDKVAYGVMVAIGFVFVFGQSIIMGIFTG